MPFPDDLRASVELERLGITIPPGPFYASGPLISRHDESRWLRHAETNRSADWLVDNLNLIWSEAFAAGVRATLAAQEKRHADPRPR